MAFILQLKVNPERGKSTKKKMPNSARMQSVDQRADWHRGPHWVDVVVSDKLLASLGRYAQADLDWISRVTGLQNGDELRMISLSDNSPVRRLEVVHEITVNDVTPRPTRERTADDAQDDDDNEVEKEYDYD
jgi:hypothetical protein